MKKLAKRLLVLLLALALLALGGMAALQAQARSRRIRKGAQNSLRPLFFDHAYSFCSETAFS